MDAARRYLVSGLVQGVGYRYFVWQRAQERGLTGYVRNLHDGRVEVVAEGPAEELEALRGDLLIGPRFAKVSGVDMSSIESSTHYDAFSMIR